MVAMMEENKGVGQGRQRRFAQMREVTASEEYLINEKH